MSKYRVQNPATGEVVETFDDATRTAGWLAAIVIRSRSFEGSYGIFLYSSALTPSGPAMLTPIVWPSGVDFAMALVPMFPEAPPLFSTTKG